MPPFSSSISNFKPRRRRITQGRLLGRALSILLWTTGALILMDAAVGFVLPAAPGPTATMQRYFDYGRSIEGKLRRYVGSSPDQDAEIMRAGWLNECEVATFSRPGKVMFDIYGMSFSNNIADHLEQLDSRLAGQRFAGPAAPPNHSYACFIRRVRMGLQRAPIQILGILASSIPRMETLSGLTTSFEAPQPFTYPRYSLTPDGRLFEHWSSIKSQEELHAALSDPTKWRTFLNELATDDAFYVQGLVKADVFDHSTLARMIRRAWAQRSFRNRVAALRPSSGFSGASDIAPVLVAMLLDFATTTRAAGGRPIVILIEDSGYGTALSSMVTPVLKANRIDFVATSGIASPTDSGNFVGSGHFTPAVDEKIARAVLNLLGQANSQKAVWDQAAHRNTS
jgi:hypothetical protein